MTDRAISATATVFLTASRSASSPAAQTPFLKKAIGMAYVPPHSRRRAPDRNRHPRTAREAKVVPLPFYKRRNLAIVSLILMPDPDADPDHLILILILILI